MPDRGQIAPDEIVFRLKADFLRSLGHPARLSIIEYLKKGEAMVGQMVNDLGIEQSALSRHLAVLRQAGILTSRQEKANVYYAIKDQDILSILRQVAEMLRKKLQESEQILNRLAKP